MGLIIASILTAILLAYYLLRGRKGIKELKRTVSGLTSSTSGKYFFIAGGISVAFLIVMLLTGQLTFKEILEIERMQIEFCPFCMLNLL